MKPKISTDFPEDIFQAPESKRALYKYKVKAGRELCKQSNVAFCGIVRNAGGVLERNLLRLHRIGQMFKEYKMFFYENDSEDNTVDILKRYASEKLSFQSGHRDDKDYRADLDNGVDPWHLKRCHILADCRNVYLNWLHTQNDIDLLCVIDLDLKGGWSYDGVAHGIHTLNASDKMACVSAYGVLTEKTNTKPLEEIPPSKYMMYDSFAFRPVGIESLHLIRTPVYNAVTFQRGDDPTLVWSNFGGMAWYKRQYLCPEIRYEAGSWGEGCVDPDHVLLHRQLRKRGLTIALDPSMIASYSPHRYCS